MCATYVLPSELDHENTENKRGSFSIPVYYFSSQPSERKARGPGNEEGIKTCPDITDDSPRSFLFAYCL